MSTGWTTTVANSPGDSLAAYVPLLSDMVRAAGYYLSSFVAGLGSIEVAIVFEPQTPTMNGGSLANWQTSVHIAADGRSYRMVTEGAGYEMLTGQDITPGAADGRIGVGTVNLAAWYHFDQTLRDATDIPRNQTDAFRIVLHELLHIVAFNSWGAVQAGDDPASRVVSLYDAHLVQRGGRTYFSGDHARTAFGSDVPVTGSHLGDAASFAAGVLTGASTVMSYDYIPNGVRIGLDPVVCAILRDLGYTVRDTQAALPGTPGLTHARFDGSGAGAALVTTLDQHWLTFPGQRGYAYLVNDVERIEFNDRRLAIDLDGAAGLAARVIGAAFDVAYLRPEYVGAALALFDGGMTMVQACELALGTPLYLALAGSPANEAFVNHVYRNIAGHAPDAAELARYVGLLQGSGGTMTQAELLALAANTEANAINIDLAGLQQSGVAYL